MSVDATTYLDDAKAIYGEIQDQVAREAIIMNLFKDGTKFAKPINNIGIRGYTFLAALKPNYNMGYRKEGVTGVGSAGNQGLKQATVSLKYAYVPITITGQAENLTKGDSKAFMQAKALEAKYDMKDIVKHINVVIAGAERGGQIAQVSAAVAPGVGTFTADATGGLPGALYLKVGMPIDTGAVGGGALSVNNSAITAINYATRAITHTAGTAVAGEAVTLTGEHPVSAGDFPLTAEGLVSLIADTGSRQGLNPATAGQETWASYLADVGGVDLSSAAIMELCQFVKGRGGKDVDLLMFPSAQINMLVSLATQLLRFEVTTQLGKKALDLGFTAFTYGGRTIVEDTDLRQDRIYGGAADMMAHFVAVPLSMADDEAGTWTRVSGASGVADAVQGLLRIYHQIGILQRSAWGVLKNFSVPASFQTNPMTLA